MSARWWVRTVAVAALALPFLAGPSADAVDPRSNSSTNGLQACPMYSASPMVTRDCLSGALSAYNAARANEGLGRMQLPSNFFRLNLPQQLFVLVNIERVDRGLWPVSGESSRLNGVGASSGASGTDQLPCGNCWGSANWAGTLNPFWTHFLWMYDDGPGGPNGSDSWGHRHNILVSSWPGPLLMGAGTGRHGTGEVFQGGDTGDRADVLNWTYESAYFTPIHTPTLRVGVDGSTIRINLTGHSRTTVRVQVWTGAGWSNVATYSTPGTPAAAALWTTSVSMRRGHYRVVATRNTRYAQVVSGTITVG